MAYASRFTHRALGAARAMPGLRFSDSPIETLVVAIHHAQPRDEETVDPR